MSNANVLRDYMVKLSKDGAEIRDFANNPEASMKKAGLSAQQMAAIRSQDRGQIATELGESEAAIRIRVIVILEVTL